MKDDKDNVSIYLSSTSRGEQFPAQEHEDNRGEVQQGHR
jgi:hypothetical protein